MKSEIIKKEKEDEINWDKIQLVVNKEDNKNVVLTTGLHCPHTFSAVRINPEDYDTIWLKANFQPFTDSILLSN